MQLHHTYVHVRIGRQIFEAAFSFRKQRAIEYFAQHVSTLQPPFHETAALKVVDGIALPNYGRPQQSDIS